MSAARGCLGRVIFGQCSNLPLRFGLERRMLRPSLQSIMDTPQLYANLLPTARRRILVVDDDPSLRLLLRETLAADEFELEEASSAEEARDIARFWQPSVVLLDVT